MLSSLVASLSSPRGGLLPSGPPDEGPIRQVLAMLAEHLGLDVVFVGEFSDGSRRFRVVEALSHGPSAAAATGEQDRQPVSGILLCAPVVLRDGQLLGRLCCLHEGDPAQQERLLRALSHGARLVARLLDNEQVLRDLHRLVASH